PTRRGRRLWPCSREGVSLRRGSGRRGDLRTCWLAERNCQRVRLPQPERLLPCDACILAAGNTAKRLQGKRCRRFWCRRLTIAQKWPQECCAYALHTRLALRHT